MLLTFPTKESLLRKIQESDPNQKYLIVANYRALANWNLIPLSELTVLLGPNSAGKSAVYDALDGLRMLVDGIRTDRNDTRVDKHYDSMRDDDQSPSIGFSGPFPNIEREIIDICNNASLNMMRDIENEVSESAFPVLSKILKDDLHKIHLKETVFTFIVDELSDEDLDISVYLDGEFSANLYSENIDQTFTITKKAANFFYQDSELVTDIFEPNREKIDISLRLKGWENFKNAPTHIFYPVPYEETHTVLNDETFGFMVALFHAPITSIIKNFKRGATNDVRQLTSGWGFCDRSYANSRWALVNGYVHKYLAQHHIQRTDNVDFPNELISNEVDVFLGHLKREDSSLHRLNRWLREPAFMATPYQVEVEIKACIPLNELSNKFEIQKYLKEDSMLGDRGVEFLGKAFLRDDAGRSLDFSKVGAGYSQMIPILVNLTSDYTVLYKQPEVHLHPRMQSKIADCFIETVNNNRISFNNFRIVETHSEHFVLRLLRRVRESFRDELLHSSLTLKSNDFSLIYFKPIVDATEIYQIRVSENGDFIDDWPDGFFDERDEDIWGASSWGSGKWGG